MIIKQIYLRWWVCDHELEAMQGLFTKKISTGKKNTQELLMHTQGAAYIYILMHWDLSYASAIHMEQPKPALWAAWIECGGREHCTHTRLCTRTPPHLQIGCYFSPLSLDRKVINIHVRRADKTRGVAACSGGEFIRIISNFARQNCTVRFQHLTHHSTSLELSIRDLSDSSSQNTALLFFGR